MTDNDTIEVAAVPALTDDDLVLRAQGHEPELPRRFSRLSVLSLAFVITNSWVGFAATFGTALLAGGGPGVFWGSIIAFVVCSIITIGLAELASAYPSAGGQYHFTFMVSSPKYRAASAFVMGWLSSLAWGLVTVSAGVYVAQLIAGIATFFDETLVFERWQIYLLFVAINTLATLIVCVAPQLLPKIEVISLWSSLLACLISTIVIGALSGPKQPARVIFVEDQNVTGWSNGFAFIIGIGTSMYTFVSTDSATHLAEEVPNPGFNIPRIMWLTPVIGVISTIPYLLVIMFSATDLEAVANSSLPILTLYQQATGNQAATAALTIWIMLNYFGATIGCVATVGRLVWAFARDNGIPFSPFFAKVSPTKKTPIRATIACLVFQVLYGLIYIGSTTAFNSIISLSILALNVTYVIPQGIVLLRGRSKVLPARSFRLGHRIGNFVNGFSFLWVAFYSVIFCFPIFIPPTTGDMNYLSPVAVGIILLILIAWYGGKRKTFTGPHIQGIEPAETQITTTTKEK
ncbi:putative amino acid permease [Exophiala viscosa]|uniref:putative amino acid permease n=1 Tax=Exophiala viscosa TaxID=2486360 RepID=UPI0021923485|nr:putative amino acid permease [Exophiala viscosa]